MKQCVTSNKRGRYDARVTLWKDGKEKKLLVARLVALTWCAGYSEGMTVNHIDGNSMNNHCSNLEWITLKDNILYGFENGQYPQKKTLIKVNGEIKTFRSMAEASRFLGRSEQYISNCISKRTKPKGFEILNVG